MTRFNVPSFLSSKGDRKVEEQQNPEDEEGEGAVEDATKELNAAAPPGILVTAKVAIADVGSNQL